MNDSYELQDGVWQPTSNYKLYLISQPAAGADFSYTFPQGFRYRIVCLYGVFTASAAVANRTINVVLKRDGNIFWKGINGAFTTNGQVATLILNEGIPYANNATQAQMPIPVDMILEQNVVLASSVTTIQSGDQWSALAMWIEEIQIPPGDN